MVGVLLTAGLIFIEPLGARATGIENFSAGAWLLRHSGLNSSGYGPGGMLAAQFFDALFPFIVLLGVSLVTRPPEWRQSTSFSGK